MRQPSCRRDDLHKCRRQVRSVCLDAASGPRLGAESQPERLPLNVDTTRLASRPQVRPPDPGTATDVVWRDCPLCGDGNETTPPSRYSLGTWLVKTCRTCDFTYLTTARPYVDLFERMSWERTSRLESERRQSTRKIQQAISRKTRWRLRLLPRRNLPALFGRYAGPGNILDLGCGDGSQLDGLAPDFVPYGIEISTNAARRGDARLRARGGRVVNAACLEGLRSFPSQYFTAASLRSYLEHELRPAEVLRELHRVLGAGGIAIVKVPNFGSLNRRIMGRRWCGFRYPDHLNYFTPKTLRRMARAQGFETAFGLTWRLPTGDNMWALLRKTAGTRPVSESAPVRRPVHDSHPPDRTGERRTA